MQKIEQIVEYLSTEIPGIPESAIRLSVLFRLSQLITHSRVRVVSNTKLLKGDGVFINIYALLFAPSGVGKSLMLRRTKELIIGPVKSDMKKDFMIGYDKWVNKKISQANEDEGGQMDEKQIKNLRGSLWKLVNFQLEPSRGTLEGILRMREHFDRAGMGSGAFVQDEFAEFIKSQNPSNKELLDILKEGYDGTTGGKALATQTSYPEVENIPMSVFMATSPYNFFGEGAEQKMWSFFTRGYARRAILCVAEPRFEEVLEVDYEAFKASSSDAIDEVVIENIAIGTYETAKSNRVIIIDDDAENMLYDYKNSNIRKVTNLKSEHYVAEIIDRWFRTLKVASISAVSEGRKHITVDDVVYAMGVIEDYSKEFEKFFEKQAEAEFLPLLNYFRDNAGRWITKSELYAQNFVTGSKQRYWIDSNTELIQELCIGTSYTLQIEKDGKSVRYRYIEDFNRNTDEARQIIKMMNTLMDVDTDSQKIWDKVVSERDKNKYQITDDELQELFNEIVLGKPMKYIDDDVEFEKLF